MSRQPDLFAAPLVPVAPAEPNLPFRRKSLSWYLRMLRGAEILPWSESEVDHLTRHFPALASALPQEERDGLVSEFFQHLDRLGFKKAA
jgi:hypothetical protein